MTLYEFFNQSRNKDYLGDRYRKMKEHLEMMKVTTGKQFLCHSNNVEEYFNYINGYIRAANVYGHITDDECDSLLSELLEDSHF